MKKLAMKLAIGRAGWLLKMATSAVASFAILFLMNTMGLDIPPDKQVEITVGIAGAIFILLQSVLVKFLKVGNLNVQEELAKFDPKLAKDGWAGDATKEVLHKVAEAAKSTTPLATPDPEE